ncbi:MAG: hypothetical protein AVDCRST_MAG85-1926 [uncultured Solirubrobacteraceae bacterium]|uniref:Lipoprotein SmpA/OmlA domain-containing protein n=1 Tax=uncultured Solirubrobacteraceae bacterium TaxID=1162706 RepID=A0A6J4SS25_9ACTN|nr:MAG: hypothetical protein AVDCRST_MAG85-1926 [uncultured Solirubrobacteraceae bacterium]
MRTRRLTLIAGLALTGSLVGPAVAPAVLEPDLGLAGAKLGMTTQEVVSVLGNPTTKDTRTDDNGGREVHWYYNATRIKVEFRKPEPGSPDIVTRLATRSGKERTAGGVGVGTPERKLRSSIRGVSCREFRVSRTRTQRACFTRGRSNGSAIGRDQTVFDVSRKTRRITAVSVSRFYD